MPPNVQVEVTADAAVDLERLTDFLRADFPRTATTLTPRVLNVLRILRDHPRMGRPRPDLSKLDTEGGEIRELIISQGRSGNLALYQFQPALRLIRVLHLRHQREAGYAFLDLDEPTDDE